MWDFFTGGRMGSGRTAQLGAASAREPVGPGVAWLGSCPDRDEPEQADDGRSGPASTVGARSWSLVPTGYAASACEACGVGSRLCGLLALVASVESEVTGLPWMGESKMGACIVGERRLAGCALATKTSFSILRNLGRWPSSSPGAWSERTPPRMGTELQSSPREL
eukprot:scaffold169688_cov29-Tisochrysis_lutea.AAC.5